MGMIKLPDDSREFFLAHVDEIFESGNLAEGNWTDRLNNKIKDYTGSAFCCTTNSNGAGLVALMSLGRQFHDRDIIYIQSNTMYGVKAMISAAGCELGGFINCRVETLMPSLEDVKRVIAKIQNKKKVIILLSHLGGIINPDIPEIAKLCKDNDVMLLEDCAHSFGATLNGKHSGLFGDAGAYSFYATKAIPAGEGGAVVTNDEVLGHQIQRFSVYDRFEQELDIGNNIRVPEVQALLIYSVVNQVEEIIENKQNIASVYKVACEDLGISFIDQDINGHRGNYYKFVVYSGSGRIGDILWNMQTLTSPIYDYSIGVHNDLADKHYCLPIWYRQSSNVARSVITELRSCFR